MIDPGDPANVDPRDVWVWVVCTDCDENASQIAMAARSDHAALDDPCWCGGERVLLRDLQRWARLGRKLEAVPS